MTEYQKLEEFMKHLRTCSEKDATIFKLRRIAEKLRASELNSVGEHNDGG